jgi:hypothetical protein
MKIIITESQYKSILKENKMERFVNDFIEKNRITPMEEVFNELFFQYGFTLNIISKFKPLEKYFRDRLSANINLDTAIGKINFIRSLVDFIGYRFKVEHKQFIENAVQGILDEVIDEINDISKGDIRKYSKLSTDIGNMLPRYGDIYRNFRALVKQKGEELGYVMVKKPLTWTFEKGGGRIQQIIDYIKEVPETPKKTRRGWMEYVGEDPDRRGWNSYLWRAVQDAGIIEKVRDGRNFTYKLGPNAEAFEQGKLIGF